MPPVYRFPVLPCPRQPIPRHNAKKKRKTRQNNQKSTPKGVYSKKERLRKENKTT